MLERSSRKLLDTTLCCEKIPAFLFHKNNLSEKENKIKDKRRGFLFPTSTYITKAAGQVSRIPRKETTPSQTVFAKTNFRYDNRFEDNFNVIPPEEALNEAIGKYQQRQKTLITRLIKLCKGLKIIKRAFSQRPSL